MNSLENDNLTMRSKIQAGLKIAFNKMVDYKRRNGGSLVFHENGKIVKIKAVDFKE